MAEKCTCEEEFSTVPCPVHGGIRQEAAFSGEQVSTVTDAVIAPDRIRVWEGFIFQCPHCKMDSIMVNPDTCPAGVAVCSNGACGRKSMVKSHIVTEFVRGMKK